MTKVLAIIPARYASTRFPGKPLALLGGKPVIQWVWNRVSAIPELADAVVATDDERIAEAVRSFGGKVIMTSSTHRSGTDRCGEVLAALESQGNQYDIVINYKATSLLFSPNRYGALSPASPIPKHKLPHSGPPSLTARSFSTQTTSR